MTVTGSPRAACSVPIRELSVIPDKPADAKGQPAEQEEHETIMHGAFAVTSRGDEIQRGADFAHLPNVVNAEGDESKQKIFKQSTFGSETVLPDWVLGLSHRLLRYGRLINVHVDLRLLRHCHFCFAPCVEIEEGRVFSF